VRLRVLRDIVALRRRYTQSTQSTQRKHATTEDAEDAERCVDAAPRSGDVRVEKIGM
jgi:hypothetical protein